MADEIRTSTETRTSTTSSLGAAADRLFLLPPQLLVELLERAAHHGDIHGFVAARLPEDDEAPDWWRPPESELFQTKVYCATPVAAEPAMLGDCDVGEWQPGGDRDRETAWEHLIYAYLIENTGILRICRRVVELFASGESLEVPSPATRAWLRTTEDLFFRDAAPFSIAALTSWIRPDLEASRRGAYWRMFGMDLNHGGADGRPYPYPRAAQANTGFVGQWESFLQEVWQGYINRQNSSGENFADPEAIVNLADGLATMLQVRRLKGNLAREEFFFVAMMSWFHLTVEANTSVVVDLKAEASSPAERLRKIGNRVGLAPHPKSRSFFELADPASTILRFVELNVFSNATGANLLTAKDPNLLRNDVLTIMNHWSIATGRDLKLRRPRAEQPAPRPVLPRPAPRLLRPARLATPAVASEAPGDSWETPGGADTWAASRTTGEFEAAAAFGSNGHDR
jgi:hypothetical protein